MKPKTLLIALGLSLIVFFIGIVRIDLHYPATAEFLLKCAAAFGTFFAIIVALFSDYLKAVLLPIKLRIEVPKVNNEVIDYGEIEGVKFAKYCHHLVVINETNYRTVVNCRVWLKTAYEYEFDEPVDKQPIAVPRLMNWAPSEWSPKERTFSTSQVFDLGITTAKNKGFELSTNEDQKGNFKKQFSVSTTLKLVFFLTADNYQGYEEFSIKVVIPVMVEGKEVTRSIVSMIG